ncbi:MAG: M23 family metallopeptidase [Proteobacteria bacterium]|nr:M23 family metallopeptidase [Pseudomonadota bacterium]
MAETLIERAWAWLHTTFPERQIYIRSDGRVQFFTFGPTLQATMAGLSLIFLGWVAFASVNVIFKDRIIAAKDHRYQQMQSTYENRVADLQISYDELNGALVSAEDRFKSVADELQTKQDTVQKLLGRKQAVDQTFDAVKGGSRAALSDDPQNTNPNDDVVRANTNKAGVASDSLGPDAPTQSEDLNAGQSKLNVMPQQTAPQPRTARPTRASFLDEAVGRFTQATQAFFSSGSKQQAEPQRVPKLPVFHALAQQTDRIRRMSTAETALLVGVDQQLSTSIAQVQGVLRRVGMNPDSLEAQVQGNVGGPFIPIDNERIEGIADASFTNAYVSASAHGKELDALFAALSHVPLTTPVRGSQFEETSDFGARVDPFTHRIAFHPGLDFGGPWGSTVASTAPGVVVWAGNRGGYGNMVEIDHGFGIRTRYGHLSAILVRVGAKVKKGTPVGKLGSTGRSTGPHVHYEVWLADVVRDPSRFIEAGRHVFE